MQIKRNIPETHKPMCFHTNRDEVNLIDAEGNVVASAKWQNADLGVALRLLPEPVLTRE